MRQVFQHQKSGEISVEELPAPQCLPGGVLVRTQASLISAGTERSSVTKAQKSLLARARAQQEDVKNVLASLRKEGLAATYRKVLNALDAYRPLGYSAAGIVVASKTAEFNVGDRVACAGSQYAYHAEIISVPRNLTTPIPDGVDFDEACYTTLGAIAMQGMRQAAPLLGESVAVIGLGLLGQLTIQLLKAAGCRVMGLDINPTLFDQARACGADSTLPSDRSSVAGAISFARGLGMDAVIITAATSSNDPLELALHIARRKARVVVVGAVGMDVPRSPFYEKELELLISCSYGPGRYDPVYEEQGIDYPAEYVRWTEKRNMQAFMDMIAMRKIDVAPLTSHRFAIDDAAGAYELITGKSDESYLGIVLGYPEHKGQDGGSFPTPQGLTRHSDVNAAFVGAGSFAQVHLIPHVQTAGAGLAAVSTSTPVRARSVAGRFGFERFATDATEVMGLPGLNLLFCATRHDSHAAYVCQALEHGLAVFVEKPLAIDREQLSRIDEAVRQHDGRVMVGFNRRFSQPFVRMKQFFAGRSDPLSMIYRVNAGAIPASHWIQDPAQGGRIIGEGCHFIDCMSYLCDALPVSIHASSVSGANRNMHLQDIVTISVKFSDGSIGTLHYFANGDKSLDKEYCEAHCEGKSALMRNFKTLDIYWGSRKQSFSYDGSKGHKEEVTATVAAVRDGRPFPISYETLRAITLATFAAVESLETGETISLL